RPAPPVHAGIAFGDALDEPRPAHDGSPSRRRSAQSDRPAFRVPLPHAMRVCRNRVRNGRSGLGRPGARDLAQRWLPYVGPGFRSQPCRRTGALHVGSPAVSDTLVDVRDLTVRFATDDGPVAALNGVDFSVAAGEVMTILGESG